jgi:hypothetical protein
MKAKTLLQLVAFMVASSFLVAGTSSAADQQGPQRSPSSDGAAVSFSNVSNGDVVPPVFIVKFSITGMGIAPAGTDIENTGHHHLLIDVQELPDLSRPLPATDNIRHFGKGQGETELQLPEGEHSLQLVLADYAHVPHEPPVVSDVIVITVSRNAPVQAEQEDG